LFTHKVSLGADQAVMTINEHPNVLKSSGKHSGQWWANVRLPLRDPFKGGVICWWGLTCSTVPRCGILSTGETLIYWSASRGGPQNWSQRWNSFPTGTGWELGLCSPEKRRLWGDLKVAFQYLKGRYKKEGDRLFGKVSCDRTRGNDFKLKEGRFRPDIRKRFLTMRLMRHWNKWPREKGTLSLETLKAGWLRFWVIWSSCGCPCSLQGSWTRWHLRVPPNWHDSMILWCFAT